LLFQSNVLLRVCLFNWNRAACDAIGEGRPFDEFQHQRLHVGRFLEPVNRADVRMIERGQDLRFTFEPSEPIRIEGERRGQDLDGHVAPELGVVRLIDLAHPARSDGGEDFVGAEFCAGSQGHGRIIPVHGWWNGMAPPLF
jgi:hypothetical protein